VNNTLRLSRAVRALRPALFFFGAALFPAAAGALPFWLRLPEQASTYAHEIDAIFHLIMWITGVIFVIVEVLLLYFLWKYRHREGRKAHYTHGNNRLEVIWTIVPALICVMLALLFWRSTLNVFSMIGLVMLMGLVTKNAILLVDFANRAHQQGATVADSDQIIANLMGQLVRRPQIPRLIQHEAVRGGQHLSQLARRFLRPLFVQGTAAMKQSADMRGWAEEELPLVISAFMNLFFGHFAMAPLLADVLDEDPLSPDVLARQTRFLQKLTRLLVTAPPTDPKE